MSREHGESSKIVSKWDAAATLLAIARSDFGVPRNLRKCMKPILGISAEHSALNNAAGEGMTAVSNIPLQAAEEPKHDSPACVTCHPRTYACDECELVFTQRSQLTRHSRVHTGEKPFACEVCGKKFARNSHVTRHLRLHTGDKPYECDQCGKRFSVNTSLNIHKRVHTGEKPFECELCGKSFMVRSNLNTHIRLHTGVKPFRCDVCGKCFAVKTRLKAHHMIHRGEKPFVCSICERRFTQKGSLNRHERSHERKDVHALEPTQVRSEQVAIVLADVTLSSLA